VIFPGKLLVERSRDPECDAARALVAKGITGKLTMLDGETGKPRTIIDIEKAARLTAERPNAPRYRRFRGMEEAPTRLKAVGLLRRVRWIVPPTQRTRPWAKGESAA
jgi:hypothetical protein